MTYTQTWAYIDLVDIRDRLVVGLAICSESMCQHYGIAEMILNGLIDDEKTGEDAFTDVMSKDKFNEYIFQLSCETAWGIEISDVQAATEIIETVEPQFFNDDGTVKWAVVYD